MKTRHTHTRTSQILWCVHTNTQTITHADTHTLHHTTHEHASNHAHKHARKQAHKHSFLRTRHGSNRLQDSWRPGALRVKVSDTYTHTHKHMHRARTHIHTRTHTRTHTRWHIQGLMKIVCNCYGCDAVSGVGS
eukprot:Colp12_sorted_trinity150504_noHs@7269